MSRVVWLLLVGGCQVVFPLEVVPAGDAPPDAPVPTCADPALIACYELDDSISDATPRSNDLVNTTGVNLTFIAGIDGGRAIQLSPQVKLAVGAPNFDGDELTIEGWMTFAKTSEQQLVIDHNFRWALSLTGDGVPVCHLASGEQVAAEIALEQGVFSHVACTQRPDVDNNGIVEVYINGVRSTTETLASFQMSPTTDVGVGADSPGSTGSFFVGAIDRLRIWNKVLSSDQILAAASAERP